MDGLDGAADKADAPPDAQDAQPRSDHLLDGVAPESALRAGTSTRTTTSTLTTVQSDQSDATPGLRGPSQPLESAARASDRFRRAVRKFECRGSDTDARCCRRGGLYSHIRSFSTCGNRSSSDAASVAAGPGRCSVCESLEGLGEAVVAHTGRLDVRALTPAQAGVVVEGCCRIEASIGALKALAAARMADSDSWKQEGCRSPAEQLGRKAKMSPSAARRALETGRRLSRQPDVARVALDGQLSPAQTEAVTDGVAADPSKAAALIDKARNSSVTELNDEVARVKAASWDAEEAHRRLRAKRSLRRWTDRDGACQTHATGLPEDGARLWRVLDPLRRRLNLLHRQAGITAESLEALDYDALATLTAIAVGGDAELSLADLRELGLFPQLDDLDPHNPDPGPDPEPAPDSELFPDRDPFPNTPAGPTPAGPTPAGPTPAGPTPTAREDHPERPGTRPAGPTRPDGPCSPPGAGTHGHVDAGASVGAPSADRETGAGPNPAM